MTFLICILIYILGCIGAWFATLWCLYKIQEPIKGDDVKLLILVILLSWLGFIAVLISYVLASIKFYDWDKLAEKINKIFYHG